MSRLAQTLKSASEETAVDSVKKIRDHIELGNFAGAATKLSRFSVQYPGDENFEVVFREFIAAMREKKPDELIDYLGFILMDMHASAEANMICDEKIRHIREKFRNDPEAAVGELRHFAERYSNNELKGDELSLDNRICPAIFEIIEEVERTDPARALVMLAVLKDNPTMCLGLRGLADERHLRQTANSMPDSAIEAFFFGGGAHPAPNQD